MSIEAVIAIMTAEIIVVVEAEEVEIIIIVRVMSEAEAEVEVEDIINAINNKIKCFQLFV